jgi:hypothetical protein
MDNKSKNTPAKRSNKGQEVRINLLKEKVTISSENTSNIIPNTIKAIEGTTKRAILGLDRNRAAGNNAVPAKIDMAGQTFEKG